MGLGVQGGQISRKQCKRSHRHNLLPSAGEGELLRGEAGQRVQLSSNRLGNLDSL